MTLSETYISRKQLLVDKLEAKGVTGYSASDGLTTLINAVSDIPSGSGCVKLVQGTFTTGSTRAGTGSTSLSYAGSGYPIAALIFIDGGAYNNTSGGNVSWYNSTNRYDVGTFYMTKAETNTTPTYSSSGSVTANNGVVTIIYKNSTSTATTYTRTSIMTAKTYNSSNASTSYNCIRFKGNAKTLSWYVGNAGSSTIGLAPSTTYAYIIIYSE